jgi:hypothetical protein
MISFKQLCYKDLGFVHKLKGKVEVKTAIMSSMVFELEMLHPLLEAKIPVRLLFKLILN